LANGQKFHDVDAAFTAFIFGHERLRLVKSISQLTLSKACGFARLDHKFVRRHVPFVQEADVASRSAFDAISEILRRHFTRDDQCIFW
jgi:hypothetical protein